MDKHDIAYWRGEIGASIVGTYESIGLDRGDEETEEEMIAYNDICDLAEKFLALKEILSSET